MFLSPHDPVDLGRVDLGRVGAGGHRLVPMPGANGPVEAVRLRSGRAPRTLLVRFPAGFVRDTPGGYATVEEFLVLDGELHLDGLALRRGDLTLVPAHRVRHDLHTRDGCTALVCFGARPDFLPPEKLSTSVGEIEVRRVAVEEYVRGAANT